MFLLLSHFSYLLLPSTVVCCPQLEHDQVSCEFCLCARIEKTIIALKLSPVAPRSDLEASRHKA